MINKTILTFPFEFFFLTINVNIFIVLQWTHTVLFLNF